MARLQGSIPVQGGAIPFQRGSIPLRIQVKNVKIYVINIGYISKLSKIFKLLLYVVME